MRIAIALSLVLMSAATCTESHWDAVGECLDDAAYRYDRVILEPLFMPRKKDTPMEEFTAFSMVWNEMVDGKPFPACAHVRASERSATTIADIKDIYRRLEMVGGVSIYPKSMSAPMSGSDFATVELTYIVDMPEGSRRCVTGPIEIQSDWVAGAVDLIVLAGYGFRNLIPGDKE